MKKIFLITLILSTEIYCQGPAFFPQEAWRIFGYGAGINVEVHDINNDGKEDIIVGNWIQEFIDLIFLIFFSLTVLNTNLVIDISNRSI